MLDLEEVKKRRKPDQQLAAKEECHARANYHIPRPQPRR
jgi:hypothetical protein